MKIFLKSCHSRLYGKLPSTSLLVQLITQNTDHCHSSLRRIWCDRYEFKCNTGLFMAPLRIYVFVYKIIS